VQFANEGKECCIQYGLPCLEIVGPAGDRVCEKVCQSTEAQGRFVARNTTRLKNRCAQSGIQERVDEVDREGQGQAWATSEGKKVDTNKDSY
jgi:hypothetical protein